MTRSTIATAVVLLCSLGCSRADDRRPEDRGAAVAPFRFRAVGQEPGWLLEIDAQKEIRFSYDYGQRTVTTPVPAPDDSSGAQVWQVKTESSDLRIVIQPAPCEDVMSGQPYPSTVTVTLNGQSYRGCGGPAGAPPTPPPSR